MKAETKHITMQGQQPAEKNSPAMIALGIFLGLAAVFTVVSFIFWTLVPQLQTSDFSQNINAALQGSDTQGFLADSFIWSPNTYAQGIMRGQYIADIFAYDNKTNYAGPNPLLDQAVSLMDAFVKGSPARYDYYLALGKASDTEAFDKNDASYEKVAEGYYKAALAMIPGRQDVIYPYSINLINQGRPDEAIALLEQTLQADPDVVETHYRLGEAYAVIGEQDYAIALGNLEYALDHGFDSDLTLTTEFYQKFMRYFYARQDLPRFTTVVERLSKLDPAQASTYAQVLAYVSQNHAIPVLNITIAPQQQ